MIAEYMDFDGNVVKYDDNLYELKKYDGLESDFILEDIYYLHYIGPQNVTPVIPEGIKICWRLFEGCTELINSPIIPDGVLDCSYMFDGCTSLVKAPIIPNGVRNCSYMFNKCISLTKVPIMPEGVKICDSMFNGCVSLEELDMLPHSCCSAKFMFKDCFRLVKAPKIPYKLKEYIGMFAGCKALKHIPRNLNKEKATRRYLWKAKSAQSISINYLLVIIIMLCTGIGLLYFLTRLLI